MSQDNPVESTPVAYFPVVRVIQVNPRERLVRRIQVWSRPAIIFLTLSAALVYIWTLDWVAPLVLMLLRTFITTAFFFGLVRACRR